MADGTESLWVSLAALVTAGGAAIGGIITGRNARLKDREAYEMHKADAAEQARQLMEQRLQQELDRYRQLARECEDAARASRKAADDELRAAEGETEKAWAAARAWMHAAYDMVGQLVQAKAMPCDGACAHLRTLEVPSLPATVDAIRG